MSGTKMCAAVVAIGVLLIPKPGVVHAQFLNKQNTATICAGCITDCNHNGRDDACDVACTFGNVCTSDGGCYNGYCPSCGNSADCNNDGVPDECQLSGNDCNSNGIPDDCEGAPQACCTGLAASDCTDIPSVCCDVLGGVSAGVGTTCSSGICGDALACCKGDDVNSGSFPVPWCDNHTPYGCVAHNGTILSTTQICAGLRGDAFPNVSCTAADADCDGVIDDACDNCSPTDPSHHCEFFDCNNTDQTDTLICDGGSFDGRTDACVNPFACENLGGGICRFDGVGNACDNCPNDLNSDQSDVDNDYVGDVCDNCVDLFNPGQEDCQNGGVGNGIGDACDIRDGTSLDCDGNTIPDECDIANGNLTDCDGDGIADICDPDIDNDGVLNDADQCDYSPSTLTVDTGGLFIGTVRADLDGDCDVDAADLALFNDYFQGALGSGDSTCSPGSNEEGLCPTCAACNSCCGTPKIP